MKPPPASRLLLAVLLLAASVPLVAVEGPPEPAAFEPRTERIPAVVESDRAFPVNEAVPDLEGAFAENAEPLSLASGDFDGDGTLDLAAGYSLASGGHGLVALWRGNVDTLFPRSPEARERRAEASFVAAPFFGPPTLFAVPSPPKHLSAGRFDADVHVDLAVGEGAGAPVWLLAGDGGGRLAPAIQAVLPKVAAAWAEGPAAVESEDPAGPIAALSLRLNSDPFRDLVFLELGSVTPAVVITAFDRTLTVDSLADDADFDDTDTVCDTDDSAGNGPCTLRAAIEEANAQGGNNQIGFNISSGCGGITPCKIEPLIELPHLTAKMTVDGSTQTEVIVLGNNGSLAAPALTLEGSQTVRDLHIWGFGGSAIKVTATSGSSFIEGCRIGKTSDFLNTGGEGNLQGIELVSASGFHETTIGGAAAVAKNVITGNGNFGILVDTTSVAATIKGNFIGTNSTGSAIPTGVSPQPVGIDIVGTIQTMEVSGNLISGNTVGLQLVDPGFGLQVKLNRIGTDLDGTAALPNVTGISVDGTILSASAAIGGPGATDGNLISGNTGSGIKVLADTTFVKIEGNYIGTTETGAAALGNAFGIEATGLQGPTIVDNVISGNTQHGVFLYTSQQTVIQRNMIGVDFAGSTAVGNGSHGIFISDASTNIQIGSIVGGDENVIAHNGAAGVAIRDTSDDVRLRENVIHSNTRLGIDLVASAPLLWDGVTLNDSADTDTGPNNFQNFPVIDSVGPNGLDTTFTRVAGTLNAKPFTNYRLEIYSTPTCDSSGFGEGESFWSLAFPDQTDTSGNASWEMVDLAIPAGHYLTVVAYEDPSGETSEFSMCRREHAACPWPSDLVLTDAATAGPQSFTACETITTDGDFSVGLFSSATFAAGVSVAFGDGLSVFGDLTVNLDPALAVP